nr:RNA-directed DNA polymerase, eukaryota, reverse transcriptase zinc-binding domain protein [Tanacetum cinerariifolium]
MSSMPNSLPKSLQQISKDLNFKPKVLLRGSNSRNSLMSVYEEALPTKNSFHLLEVEDKDQSNKDGDINVQEELGNKVWPTLKEEVDILIEAGIYPSKAIRMDWTIHQMDYFYKNCYKYNLDPSYEDDDVESEKDGIAYDMKPEFDISVADNIKNDKRSLWKSLQKYKRSTQDALWVMLRDFNATLDPAKKSTSGSKVTTTMGDFRDCIADIEIEDIAMSGLRFTWKKKPVKKGRSYTVYPIEEPQSLFHKKISLTDATYMVRNNTTEEIKSAFFDIDKNKAPGLDGFSFYFSVRLGLLLVMIYAKLSWNSLGLESCLKRGYARCAFKVDIQKAYDYVEWKFLESCLVNFGFHRIMIKWIMECVSSTSFSININGNMEGFFRVKGVLGMALDEFRNVSGLLPSLTKSTVIFSNVKEATKAKILKIMPLSIWKLPATFLGVPLISKIEVNEGFLWNFSEFKKGKAKMKWSDVYKPNVEILEVRSLLREHIISRIGDGKDISLWFDNWNPICPLSSFIYKRNIHYSGLSLHSKMADVIDRGVWAWPKGLSDELDGLDVIEPFDLVEDRKYKPIWKTNNSRHKIFNVSTVWNDLRDGN